MEILDPREEVCVCVCACVPLCHESQHQPLIRWNNENQNISYNLLRSYYEPVAIHVSSYIISNLHNYLWLHIIRGLQMLMFEGLERFDSLPGSHEQFIIEAGLSPLATEPAVGQLVYPEMVCLCQAWTTADGKHLVAFQAFLGGERPFRKENNFILENLSGAGMLSVQ